MNMKVFCCAVGLMTAGTWAQAPIFKIWVTEVYEINPDGTYTAKCGAANCPTQDLRPGIVQPGDLINIEVMVEGWDASTDAGECSVDHEVCSVSAQDCALSHCSGSQTSAVCTADGDCIPPDTCDPDSCEKSPLLGAFQWTIDSSTYSNGGPGPGLAPAELACTTDADCACAYTEVPGDFNDCADFAEISEGFCTCAQAWCDENVCDARAVAYIDLSAIPNYVFSGCPVFPNIEVATLDYEIGASCVDGVPEERFRCTAGSRPICNVDADCPSGTCELVATSPYYLGTLLLEATGESCGLFTLDLLQDTIGNIPISTFLRENDGTIMPTPVVETLTIDLGVCQTVCTFENLMDATWADADPLPIDPFDRPGNCAIDPREPHSISDMTAKEGWDRLVLTFSCDPTELATTLMLASFPVQTDPLEVAPPAISGFVADAIGQTITIPLDRSISPGFYTCISHIDSGNHWCAGYLPADASLGGLSNARDINALINAINLVPGLGLPIYATDINRSGVTTGADVLRLIDLLNGAGDFNPWIAHSLPPCPSAGNER